MADDDGTQQAILDEGLKKEALIWLELDTPGGQRGSRGHARWYAWVDGCIYLLTGRGEQPDPGLVAGQAVRVVVRSKDNRHRMIAFDADVTPLRAEDADWEIATAELAKVRLNLFEAEDAARRWTEPGFALYRLIPRLPLAELPEDAPDASNRTPPVSTDATTSARRPWVLHRRGGSGRRLS